MVCTPCELPAAMLLRRRVSLYTVYSSLFKSAVGLILVLGSNYLSKKVTDETIY